MFEDDFVVVDSDSGVESLASEPEDESQERSGQDVQRNEQVREEEREEREEERREEVDVKVTKEEEEREEEEREEETEKEETEEEREADEVIRHCEQEMKREEEEEEREAKLVDDCDFDEHFSLNPCSEGGNIEATEQQAGAAALVAAKDSSGGNSFGWSWSSKVTMSVGQLLMLLLGNCVLSMYSYGVLIQYTNRSRSEPINVYFLERKMSGVVEDSLSRYTAMQSWDDRGSRASSGNNMDHVDDQTCMIPKHPIGKLSKTRSTSSASTSTSTSSFRARVKQESLKKLHAGVAKNESSTSQLEGKVYASASNEACGLKLKFLSDRLSDCEEESDFWFEKWLDGSSSIQMRTKVQRASEEESDFWFDKWLGSSNKLQWYEKAQQSKCRYGKAFRRSSCARAQEV